MSNIVSSRCGLFPCTCGTYWAGLVDVRGLAIWGRTSLNWGPLVNTREISVRALALGSYVLLLRKKTTGVAAVVILVP